MDPVDVVALTRALVDVDSTTGQEAAVGALLGSELERRGYRVERQKVDGDRANLLASLDDPLVVLSTHQDCVPPFFASRMNGDVLYGRGACDAKGTIAAQVAAAERLRAEGERRVGLLFVVGEERGSDGARAAAALARGSRFLVNGEPTESKLARATRGALRVTLRARGRAAHSSQPHLGESAIEKLVSAIVALREIDLPRDRELGATFYSVGLMAGGVAPNVIPAHAEADVMFRTIGEGADVLARLAPLGRWVDVEPLLDVPPQQFTTVPGFTTEVFPFTTDAPWLRSFGTLLLFGPGSASVAHTDEEHVRISELRGAVDAYVRIARALLE